MAKERWFTGFEDANGFDLTTSTAGIIADARWPARSGDYFLSCYAPGGAIRQARRLFVHGFDAPGDGDNVTVRMQVAFRVRQQVVSGGPEAIFGLGIGTTVAPQQALWVTQTTDNSFGLQGTHGTTPGSFRPALNRWYIGRLHFQWQRNNSGTDPFVRYLEIYDGATMETDEPLLVGRIDASGTMGASGFSLGGFPCLGSNTTVNRIIDFDDWWLSAGDGADGTVATNPDLDWPTGSRIYPVPITSQVIGGWTGSYILASDCPNSAVAGNEQTTVATGATSTFQHASAQALGLIPIGEEGDTAPFRGLPVPEGFSSGASTYFTLPQDMTLPTPTLQSFTLTAGAGQFNSGVWIRAFTIEWRSQGGGNMIAFGGPLTAPVFLSASAAPNFAANIQIAFNAATPADRFLNPASPGTSEYRRYGLGLIVTNGYNERGQLNPFTDQLNLSGTQTNTTDLDNYGGPGAIDAGPWGSLVALFSTVTPNGTLPPYDSTNPSVRPSAVTFLLSSPRPSGTAGNATTTNLFGPIFGPPMAQDADLPVCAAFKVTPALQLLAGSGNHDILIDSVATSVAVTTAFGGLQQHAFDWTERTAEEFDALTYGVRAGALASTLRLGSIMGEVLSGGPGAPKNTGSGQYQQQCGIYVSNNGYQKIATPFKPTAVMVKRIGTAATPGSFKAWWMGGTQSWTINGVVAESIAVMRLDDDGFFVGPSNAANGIAATYAYLACRDGQEDTLNDAYMVTGSFQRLSGSDPDQIVELPLPLLFAPSWTPDVVYLFPGNTYLKTPDMVSPNSDQFSTTGLLTTGIVALGDRTFTTGSAVNVVGQWVFLAYKFDAGGLLATLFQAGAFAGTGGVQVIPTNFRGEIIVLDHPASSYAGRFRSDQGNVGNNSVPWIGGAVTTIDITAIGNADFTVGAGASVVGQTSYWTAWKKDGSIGNTGGSDIPPPGDGGGGGGDDPPTDGELCGGGGMHLPSGTLGGAGCTAC